MASHTATPPTIVLSDVEADVLALFDQLQQLQLELALLRSQQGHHASGRVGPAQDDLARDQTQLLEAKATLALRNSVVENVVTVQPTLKAVHRATHASPAELDLLPNIEQRDAAAIKAATICADLQAAKGRLAEFDVECLAASHRNIELASEALQLAGITHDQKPTNFTRGRFEREIVSLEGQMKSSRHRWRVMKGAASAIVAGSSVDWVRDARLRNLVLDPPD